MMLATIIACNIRFGNVKTKTKAFFVGIVPITFILSAGNYTCHVHIRLWNQKSASTSCCAVATAAAAIWFCFRCIAHSHTHFIWLPQNNTITFYKWSVSCTNICIYLFIYAHDIVTAADILTHLSCNRDDPHQFLNCKHFRSLDKKKVDLHDNISLCSINRINRLLFFCLFYCCYCWFEYRSNKNEHKYLIIIIPVGVAFERRATEHNNHMYAFNVKMGMEVFGVWYVYCARQQAKKGQIE